jgi:hypothetical protein
MWFVTVAALQAALACSPHAALPDQAIVPIPARVSLGLTPQANTFLVGTLGHVTARAFDQANQPMPWTAPLRLETSDSLTLAVNPDTSVLARRVGLSWLWVTWAGPVAVRDSVLVAVGYRGLATVRFVPVEGGCWGIVTENPLMSYEAPYLPSAFKVDRLRVRVAVHPLTGGSFCMIGPLVDFDSLQVTP